MPGEQRQPAGDAERCECSSEGRVSRDGNVTRELRIHLCRWKEWSAAAAVGPPAGRKRKRMGVAYRPALNNGETSLASSRHFAHKQSRHKGIRRKPSCEQKRRLALEWNQRTMRGRDARLGGSRLVPPPSLTSCNASCSLMLTPSHLHTRPLFYQSNASYQQGDGLRDALRSSDSCVECVGSV